METHSFSPGDDLGGTGHSAMNFTGAAGSGGDTWITVYNPTSPTPTTFGTVTVHADVIIHPRSNSKGAGVMSLFTAPADHDARRAPSAGDARHAHRVRLGLRSARDRRRRGYSIAFW